MQRHDLLLLFSHSKLRRDKSFFCILKFDAIVIQITSIGDADTTPSLPDGADEWTQPKRVTKLGMVWYPCKSMRTSCNIPIILCMNSLFSIFRAHILAVSA